MSDLYGPCHRLLQGEDGSTLLADRLEAMAHDVFSEDEADFIGAASLFFLSTVDHRGRPTVSYKGGAPGFVRFTGDGHLAFPDYDGNGMMLSLGNIAGNPEVGLLFIDFESPRRLRVQGVARFSTDETLRSTWPGAHRVVQITPRQIFVNCGRYIHEAVGGLHLSRHVPDAEGQQPFPKWKRIDAFADVISPDDDRQVAREGGRLAFEDYAGEH